MTVCRYFLQGNCRYGNSCWNEHPTGGNQGYSVTAQRQLFGGNKRGGGGGAGQQKVSFRDSFGQNQNPYRWLNQDAQQQQQQNRQSVSSIQQMSASDLVKGLSAEVATTWEGGNMWPFTCLSFEKDMPSLPGFEDVSPEEMRLEAYEALKGGNIQPYIQKVQGAFNQLNAQRQELKNPSLTVKQTLISFIDDCRRKKSSGTSGQVSLFSDSSTAGDFFGDSSGSGLFSGGNSTTSSGLFSQSASSGFGQTGGQSLFGQGATQSGGLFGQNTAQSGLFGQTGSQSGSSSQTGLFGKSSAQSGIGQTGSQSLFGHGAFAQGSQPRETFGQSTFGQAQAEQPSIFGQPIQQSGQTTRTIFGQPVSQTGLFGKPDNSPFSGASFSTPQPAGASSGNAFHTSTPLGQSSAPVTNLFGKSVSAVPPGSGFGSPTSASQQPAGETTSVYTAMEKLTAEEIEQFKAPTFTLGKIPTKPPPRELCF